jgi:hypothetical protein
LDPLAVDSFLSRFEPTIDEWFDDGILAALDLDLTMPFCVP